jgi:hypothetical protein
MVVELPCKSNDNDNFDLLDADRNNVNDDIERSYMRLGNTSNIPVGTL